MGDVIHYLELRARGLTKGHKFKRCRISVKNLLEDVAAQPVHNHPCEFSGEPRATFLMDFSPNMLRVASTHGDHTVRVTDIRTGKCTHILTGHPRTPWCLAFNPTSDEILASGCLSGEIRIWDLMGGGSESLQNPCTGQVITSLAFHPSGSALIFATMNRVYFWDWSQPYPFTMIQTSHDHEWIRWLKYDPLGHYLYTGIANNPASQREATANSRDISNDHSDSTDDDSDNPHTNHRYQRLLQRFMTIQQERRSSDNLYFDPPRSPVLQEGLDSARDYADFVTLAAMGARQRARDYVEGIRGPIRRRSILNRNSSETRSSSSPWLNLNLSSSPSASTSNMAQSQTVAPDVPRLRRGLPGIGPSSQNQQGEPHFPRRWGRYHGPSFFSRIERGSSGAGENNSDDDSGGSSYRSLRQPVINPRRSRVFGPSYVSEVTSSSDLLHGCGGETAAASTSRLFPSRQQQQRSEASGESLDPNEFEIVPVEGRHSSHLQGSTTARGGATAAAESSTHGSDYRQQREEIQSLLNRFLNRCNGRPAQTSSFTPSQLQTTLSSETNATASERAGNTGPGSSTSVVYTGSVAAGSASGQQLGSSLQYETESSLSSSRNSRVFPPLLPQHIPSISVSTTVGPAILSATQRLSLALNNTREQGRRSNVNSSPATSTVSHMDSFEPYSPSIGPTWRRNLTLRQLDLPGGLLYRHHQMSSLQDRLTPRPVTDQTSQTLGAMNLPERSDQGTDVAGLGDSQTAPGSFVCFDLCEGESNIEMKVTRTRDLRKDIIDRLPTIEELESPEETVDVPDRDEDDPSISSYPEDPEEGASLSSLFPSSSPTAGSLSAFQESLSVTDTLFSDSVSPGSPVITTESMLDVMTSSSTVDSSNSTAITNSSSSVTFCHNTCDPTSISNSSLMPSANTSLVDTFEQSQDVNPRGSITANPSSSSLVTELLFSNPRESSRSQGHSMLRDSLIGRRSTNSTSRLRHFLDTTQPSAFSVFGTSSRDAGHGLSDFRTSSSLLSPGSTSPPSSTPCPPRSGPQHQPLNLTISSTARSATEPYPSGNDNSSMNTYQNVQQRLQEAVQQIHDVQSSVRELTSTTPSVSRRDSFTEYLERRVLELDRRISSLEESYNSQLLELNRDSPRFRPHAGGGRASEGGTASSDTVGQGLPPRIPPRSLMRSQPGASGDAGDSMFMQPRNNMAQHNGSGDGPRQRSRRLFDCLVRQSHSQNPQAQRRSRSPETELPVSSILRHTRNEFEGHGRAGPPPPFIPAYPNFGENTMSPFENLYYASRDLQRRLPQGSLGPMSREDHMLSTGVMPQTYRIQQWDVAREVVPNITDASKNVVVRHCKLRNAASCDLSKDGSLLATIIPGQRALVDNVVAVFSVQSDSFAQCLFTKKYGPDAISLSISPGNRYIMLGLAAQRLIFFSSNHLVAEIYKLAKEKAGENSMQHVTTLYHYCDDETRTNVSANSARWLPGIGEGIMYGTNRGDLNFCRPGSRKVLERESPKSRLTAGLERNGSSRSARRRVARNSIATQTTTVSIRRSASTQTMEGGRELEQATYF